MAGQGRDTRETTVGGHTVRVTGGGEPVRAFRGFFSGDPIGVSHHADTAGETQAARAAAEGAPEETAPAEPSGVVTIEVDEHRFDFHRLPEGWLHSHRLPFTAFRTVDEAVDALVRIVDRGSAHGRAPQSQQTD